MRKPLACLLLISVVCSSSVPAAAQGLGDLSKGLSVMVGASLYAKTAPRFAGNLSLLKPLDTDTTFSFTSFEMRGDVENQPVTSVTTGLARKIACSGPLCLYGVSQLGATGANSVANFDWDFTWNAGGALSFSLPHNLELIGVGRYIDDPAAPGQDTKITIGIGYKSPPAPSWPDEPAPETAEGG